MWPRDEVGQLVEREFLPVRVHVRDHPEAIQELGARYGAEWTPAILMLDPSGRERHRVEGFLPAEELVPRLEFGLGRIAFSRSAWEDAEARFRHVVEAHPDAEIAPEALYWAGVSRYKATDDGADLARTAADLEARYPDSPSAVKASVWA